MAGLLDDLAAGDEVRAVIGQLDTVQRQLESMGATPARRPLGHIAVPRTAAGVPLPAGKATVDFRDGTLDHEDLGRVLDDLVTVEDLMAEADREQLTLKNVIIHSDTLASADLGPNSQEIFFSDVPLPTEDITELSFRLGYPGEISILASTQRLPIGLGAITVNGQRHGEHALAVTDSFEAVPVSPFELWDDHAGTYAKATVYTAPFDTATWTVENTSGNANALVAEVQAKEAIASAAADWRTIASDTIPDGDHSIFHVNERHKLQRVRVKNDVAGDQVAASVDLMEANP